MLDVARAARRARLVRAAPARRDVPATGSTAGWPACGSPSARTSATSQVDPEVAASVAARRGGPGRARRRRRGGAIPASRTRCAAFQCCGSPARRSRSSGCRRRSGTWSTPGCGRSARRAGPLPRSTTCDATAERDGARRAHGPVPRALRPARHADPADPGVRRRARGAARLAGAGAGRAGRRSPTRSTSPSSPRSPSPAASPRPGCRSACRSSARAMPTSAMLAVAAALEEATGR